MTRRQQTAVSSSPVPPGSSEYRREKLARLWATSGTNRWHLCFIEQFSMYGIIKDELVSIPIICKLYYNETLTAPQKLGRRKIWRIPRRALPAILQAATVPGRDTNTPAHRHPTGTAIPQPDGASDAPDGLKGTKSSTPPRDLGVCRLWPAESGGRRACQAGWLPFRRLNRWRVSGIEENPLRPLRPATTRLFQNRRFQAMCGRGGGASWQGC